MRIQIRNPRIIWKQRKRSLISINIYNIQLPVDVLSMLTVRLDYLMVKNCYSQTLRV